jgi:FPC/CPF motif-containing protein YcgG
MSLAARIGLPERQTALRILFLGLSLAACAQPAVTDPTGAGRQSLATEQLMAAFYEHLERTGDRAGALREAMLATRTRFRDPGKWAGFTFIGIEPEKVPSVR